MADDDPGHLHAESYLWGLEIGLQTALCCRDRRQIEDSLARVIRQRKAAEARRQRSPVAATEASDG
jgi:hypothetical protein